MTELKLVALRGATTVKENTPEAIRAGVQELMDQLVAANALQPDRVMSALFSVSPDITAWSPPQVARVHLGWDTVAMLCLQEADIVGMPTLCIRVLITLYSEVAQKELNPVYLNGAAQLRPEWAAD